MINSFSNFRSAMTHLTGISGGDAQQKLLQALGMDQRTAALHGALHDLSSGNLAGYQQNLFEAFQGVEPGRLGAGMAPSHFMPAPSVAQGQRFDRVDLKHLGGGGKLGGLGGLLGGFALGGPLGAVIGLGAGATIGARANAKVLERRLTRDPVFRAQFEASVGGRFVPDGRNDGKITISRPNFGLPGLNPGIFGAFGSNPIAGSALSGLAAMQMNAANMMAGLTGTGIGSGLSGLSNAYGSAYGTKSTFGMGPQKPGSYMANLPPNATFEDLVSAFMMDTVKEQQEEVKKLMDKLKSSNETNGGSRSGYGGALGGLGQIAGGALGGLVGGPIGAGLGSQLGGALGGAGGGQGADKSDSRQIMFEEMKNMMNKLQQMQQAMSNVLNTMHQGSMNSIRKISG